MARLSLWNKNKGQDYKFIDNTIREMFHVGGTDFYIHKYLGVHQQGETEDPTNPNYQNQSEKNIQDLLFLENRDRKYDSSIYEIRGVYNVSDTDFDLSQFGIFLNSATVFATVHINETVEILGRKLLSGDVVELPHLRDFNPLDSNLETSLARFYVIDEVTNASEGFSPTWWPHLYRVKLSPLVDSQEFKDITSSVATTKDGSETNSTIKDLLSTYNQEMEINQAAVEKANIDVPLSGYETDHFYVVPTNPDNTVNTGGTPTSDGWTSGYLTGDGLPPNGHPAGHGISFPTHPTTGDYFLRTDFLPNRLFRYSGSRWLKIEDNVRANLDNFS